jgi:hypothetical protein
VIQLRNAIGAVIDTKRINFVPKHVCMGNFYFAAANDRVVYTWQFQSQVVKAGFASSVSVFADSAADAGGQNADSPSHTQTSHLTGKSRERMFDIESVGVASAQPPETFKVYTETVADPIVCVTLTDKYLVCARKQGTLMRFSLPHLSQESVFVVPNFEPFRIEMNCTSSKCALIDASGVMCVCDFEARVASDKGSHDGEETHIDEAPSKQLPQHISIGAHFGKKLANVEKRDVWDCKWAEGTDLLWVQFAFDVFI